MELTHCGAVRVINGPTLPSLDRMSVTTFLAYVKIDFCLIFFFSISSCHVAGVYILRYLGIIILIKNSNF